MHPKDTFLFSRTRVNGMGKFITAAHVFGDHFIIKERVPDCRIHSPKLAARFPTI